MKRYIGFVFTCVLALALCGTASAAYVFEYTVDGAPDNGCPQRVRGIAVFGEDDVVGMMPRGHSVSTNDGWIYTGATGGQDVPVMIVDWTNPDSGGDTNGAQWGWGVHVSSVDGYIYATVGNTECPVLVWDTSGNSIKYAASTRQPDTGANYTAALDTDAAGNVYVSGYAAEFEEFTAGVGADAIVLPPATAASAWEGTDINDITHASGHNPTPLTGIVSNHFVDEGLCVTPDGTTVFMTDRDGAHESHLSKFVGTPAGGYIEVATTTFFYTGSSNARGVDCADDGSLVYVCIDPAGGERIDIVDGATGAVIESVDVTAATGGSDPHNGPYDVEVTSNPYGSATSRTSNNNLWVGHMYSWYIDKWAGATPVDDWTMY